MNVYEDFFLYTSGVYRSTSGDLVGTHSVKLIGWGTLDGTDYWLGVNSWGTDWGEAVILKRKIKYNITF